MNAQTPLLKVNQLRTQIVNQETMSVWADYWPFSAFFQVPVTKSFRLVISTEHVPYSIKVHIDRREGTVKVINANLTIQMRLGWNNFLFHELIPSGDYWLAVSSAPAVPAKKKYVIPVRIAYKGEVEVEADNLAEAMSLALACRTLDVQFPTPVSPTAKVEGILTDSPVFKKLKQEEKLVLGRRYWCKSSSRPQINNQAVTLMEIKTARQVGVRDKFGDVYYTNPANLTPI